MTYCRTHACSHGVLALWLAVLTFGTCQGCDKGPFLSVLTTWEVPKYFCVLIVGASKEGPLILGMPPMFRKSTLFSILTGAIHIGKQPNAKEQLRITTWCCCYFDSSAASIPTTLSCRICKELSSPFPSKLGGTTLGYNQIITFSPKLVLQATVFRNIPGDPYVIPFWAVYADPQ